MSNVADIRVEIAENKKVVTELFERPIVIEPIIETPFSYSRGAKNLGSISK